MQILIALAYIYLGIGTIYGLYLLLSGNSNIWGLPINILGGPIMIIYNYLDVKKHGGKRRG